ncbi:MAG TPA: hypothetical protein VHV75_08405 [Solirubrobacteraceae bacterium]|jgi:hypothetical protein|nr:hypothetical protein [Solirubrobacteraceae bacterium]
MPGRLVEIVVIDPSVPASARDTRDDVPASFDQDPLDLVVEDAAICARAAVVERFA